MILWHGLKKPKTIYLTLWCGPQSFIARCIGENYIFLQTCVADWMKLAWNGSAISVMRVTGRTSKALSPCPWSSSIEHSSPLVSPTQGSGGCSSKVTNSGWFLGLFMGLWWPSKPKVSADCLESAHTIWMCQFGHRGYWCSREGSWVLSHATSTRVKEVRTEPLSPARPEGRVRPFRTQGLPYFFTSLGCFFLHLCKAGGLVEEEIKSILAALYLPRFSLFADVKYVAQNLWVP